MKTYADLMKMTREVRQDMVKSMPSISREITSIIRNQEQDVRSIEKILDNLLDYSRLCVGEKSFNRLNNYYATFRPKNAEAYNKIYKAITEDL
ncbi:MAG TPA: hypothetical protein VJ461_01135 [Candidatus Nanoarchaeia archaeon]|nr:hypothetical protein [Candidatus Nanoarchaeia archaeon]